MESLNGNRLPPAVMTAMSPPRRPTPSRSRSTSKPAVRSLKMLSLPILSVEGTAGPTDPSAFLTAVATQERRVLELKEDLQRAEMDLDKLKKQWALHEATRKRDESRNIGRLETFKGASDRPPFFEPHREGAPKSKELERRRAKYAGTKQPQRKVFSGSRLTRALSLLAPNPSTCDRQSRIGGALRLSDANSTDPKLGRSSIVPDSVGYTTASPTGSAPASMLIGVGQPKDAILQTGKQIVGDFKQGLWTFIDDLRQATVGDEAVHGPVRSADDRALSSSTNRQTARKPTTRTGLHLKNRPTPKQRDVIVDVPAAYLQITGHGGDPSLIELNRGHWERNGVKSMPTAPYDSNSRDENNDNASLDGDGWENWDSPTARSVSPYRWTDVTSASGQTDSSSTVGSSSRTSMRYVAFRQMWYLSCSSTHSMPRPIISSLSPSKRNEIPWPAMTKFSPGNLRRIASTLMSGWEKSLALPAGSEGSRDLIGLRAPFTT